jgi:hypothetical protein
MTAGTYYLSAWARDASSTGMIVGSLGAFDASTSTAYALTPVPCTGTTLSASPASPSLAGSALTFTGAASGCPNSRYEFWMRPAGSPTWQMVQTYSTNPALSWNSSGASGTYYFSIWAKDASSTTATFDANATVTYVVNLASCASVTLTAAPVSPSTSGTKVTFTGSASGCSNANPFYEFWMRPASSSTWQMIQAYSTSATLSWNSSRVSGIIYFSVWAKDAGSPTGSFDANATVPYLVNPASCGSVTISASPVSPSAAGTQVTFTAIASGCSNAGPLYEFWFLNGSTWQVAQGWSTVSTWTWNTTGLAPGTYHLSVWVRDAASPGVNSTMLGTYDAYAPIPYSLG